jgi:rubrerythrin
MLTGKEDLLRAIVEAYLMEKGTREFYREASDQSKHTEARSTYRELANWEQKHMDYLRFLYQSIYGDKEIKSFDAFDTKTDVTDTEAGIPVKDLESRIEKHTISDEKQALTLAMEIEGKAYNLYWKLSKHAEDSNAKVIFREMMEQEVKHINYLKQLRLKLVKVY